MTFYVTFCDECRQAVTLGSPEAQKDWLTNHLCGDDEVDDE